MSGSPISAGSIAVPRCAVSAPRSCEWTPVRDEFLTVPAHNPSSLSKITRAHVVVHGCGPASTSAVRPASQQLVEAQATYDQQRQRDQLRVGAEARAWIDILVNSVWGGCEGMIENGAFTWSKPFWEQPLWRWDAMFYAGVRAHYHASQLAAPMMIAQSATAGSRRNGGNCQKGPEKRKSRAISGTKDDDPHPRYDLTKALIGITMNVVA